MKVLNSKVAQAIADNENFYYCFKIYLQDTILYLTNSSYPITMGSITYNIYSGLTLFEGNFNDCGNDYIIIKGIFEDRGINNQIKLINNKIKILIVYENCSYHYLTYRYTNFTKYNLDFLIKLESEARKYNKTIISAYSLTCLSLVIRNVE